MKLNKKGFAFSTMLYGCIALIAAVLYIILNTSKSSSDTTYYYGEEILQDLNECVTEEIALENCYSSGNTNCNATAYHACLGVSDSNATEKGVIVSESLKGKPNLVLDPYNTVGNRYIYTGSDPSNFIEYSGRVWRIVSIERDGSLLLIDTQKYTDDKWDSQSGGVWNTSTLYTQLNSNYFSNLYDNSKIIQWTWYLSLLYPSIGTSTYNINNLIEQEYKQSTVSAKVGLLQLSDYLKATGNQECINDPFGQNDEIEGGTITQNCNSWLTQYKGWVIDVSGEEGSDSDGYAYYFGEKTVRPYGSSTNVVCQNVPVYGKTNTTHAVYPVININRNSILKGGNGTAGDPYVLK